MGKRRLRKKYGSAGVQQHSPSSSRHSVTTLPSSNVVGSPPAPSVTLAIKSLSQPTVSSPTAGLTPRTADEEQLQPSHPSPSAVSHHLSLPNAPDDRSSFSSQLLSSQGSSFSTPGAVDDARLSVTHSRSSRVFHVSEAKREKEYQKQRKVSAMMGTASPLTHSPLRASQSRSVADRDSIHPIAAVNNDDSHNSIISHSSMMSPAPLPDSLSLSTLPTLDTDDLPFHMLDPETMKLGLDLSFVDYPGTLNMPHTSYRIHCCAGSCS